MSANDVRDTLALIAAGPIFLLMAYMLPGWWQNKRGMHADTPPASARYSPATFRAFVRAWPCLAIGFLVCIPLFVAFKLAADGSALEVTLETITGLACVLFWFILAPAIALWNRPSFLVAPHLRRLPGWLAERRGARPDPVPVPANPPPQVLARRRDGVRE